MANIAIHLRTDKKKALLAYKEKLLNDIKYYEKRINEVSHDASINTNFEDSSDSEDECLLTINHGPTLYNLKVLKQQQAMLQTCLLATQELSSLFIQQSKVDIMVEDPVFERELPVTKPGLWRKVKADCRIDLVPFSTTFYVHQADGLFGPKSFRSLEVLPLKPAQEVELARSVLTRMATPSDAVEVLRNYSIAYRSRRATLARLADKYQSNLYMEPMATGGYLLKCANLLEISWVLENKWSCVAPFYHKMEFELEPIDECYIKIIRHAHKQLKDPSTETNERTLTLAKIITTCLEAHGTQMDDSMDSDADSVKKIEKRRLTLENDAPEPKKVKNNGMEDAAISENNKENMNTDDQIMAPPKSLPKKAKPKGKENTDQNKKSVKRPAGEDEAGNVKKAKTNKNDPNNKINKNDPNNKYNINKVVDDVIEKNQDVNDIVDRNKNIAESQGSDSIKDTEKTQPTVNDTNNYSTEKKRSTDNIKNIQKVTKSQNPKEKVIKNQDNGKASIKDNQKVKTLASQNQEKEEQSNGIETKNNHNDIVDSTQNVKGKDMVPKNQNLKGKNIKNQNKAKKLVKESQIVTKSKDQAEITEDIGNDDNTLKEKVNNKQIKENGNMQEKLKKKVTRDTDSQKVITTDKIDEKRSKNAQSSENNQFNDEVSTQPQNDPNTKNLESQKVRNKEKNDPSSNNDQKSKSKESKDNQLGISPKADQIHPENIARNGNKAKIIELDDIPILSTYNDNINKVSKKDNINVKPVKTTKVAPKNTNLNEKAITTDKAKNNPKSVNTNKNDSNVSNQNAKKSVVNKETKSNSKIASSSKAVSRNNKQLGKNNTNNTESKNIQKSGKENNSKDFQKTDTLKLKLTQKDTDKNTINSNHKKTDKQKVNQNQEKVVNNKENADSNSKVTSKKSNIIITEKVSKIGYKQQMVNLKSNRKILESKTKLVVKNFAPSKKTSNSKIGIENDSGSKISKIPMKLSFHGGLKKQNHLRTSPRLLPATFKNTSDLTLKQKSYFTNIPRLMKNTVFKKI